MPEFGKWMIDYFPSFIRALQRAIYNVIDGSIEKHYKQNSYLNDVIYIFKLYF
jgi:hypothetical protein